jgi:hypothetical protein
LPYFTWAQNFPGESLGERSVTNQGFIPCGNIKNADGIIQNPCEVCHIFVLGQNILNFLWWSISIPIATLALIYAGFLMIIPGASSTRLEKGKKVLTNTLIGIAIVFFAWLGIDTIIKILAGQNLTSGEPAQIQGYGPWNRIECNIQGRPPAERTAERRTTTSTTQTPSTGGVQSRICTGCVNLSVPKGPKTCKDQARGQICQINSVLNQKLYDLNERFINDGKLNYWGITEAWPPTLPQCSATQPPPCHSNTCHPNATCVDANFIGSARGDPQEVRYFIQQNQGLGLRAVYEVKTPERKQELVSQGVPASNIEVVGRITGEHFSIYLASS